MRPARGLALAIAIAIGAVCTAATPASAHGLGGLQPTNYETRVLRVTPVTPGLRVDVSDLGTRLELTNESGRDVVVEGYEGEPYLRVGPAGVFENRRSPAVYLNKSLKGTTKVPASADAEAAPEWRRVGDGPTVRWHDHRAHWMGTDDPPAVQRDSGSEHLIQRFTVKLTRAGQQIRVVGDVRWVPGPSPWSWIAGALVLALALVVLGRRRRWGIPLAVGLGVLVVSQALHVVGLWGASTESSWSHLASSAYSLGGMTLAVVGIVVIVKRGAYTAAPVALLAGLFIGIAGGLADVTTLSHSQVPTTISLGLDRLAVALTIGAGLGVAIVAGLHMHERSVRRRPPPRTRATEDESGAEAMRRRHEALATPPG